MQFGQEDAASRVAVAGGIGAFVRFLAALRPARFAKERASLSLPERQTALLYAQAVILDVMDTRLRGQLLGARVRDPQL